MTSPSGSTACTTCDKGKYGMKGLCHDCPAGLYQDSAGQLSCQTCPLGWSQSNNGSQACLQDPGLSPDDCGDSQFLNNREDDYRKWSCDPCPRGGSCRGPVQWRDVAGPANKSGIRALFGWSRCSQNGSSSEGTRATKREGPCRPVVELTLIYS